MLPMVEVPPTIRKRLRPYRDLFRRTEGFEHVSRYVSGLLVSPNKTLQGIYAQQVWEEAKPSRRAMHEAVFEAGWDAEQLLPRHRALIAPEHRGQGREVISLDWTLVHHERGPHIYGTTKSYDYVAGRMGRFQTVVTAVIANRHLIDGIDLELQEPSVCKEEETYLKATVQASYEQMEQARTRLLELLHHLEHKLAYKKRTEIVVEMVAQLEEEGHFPQADYAFDNGVLTVELTRLIESKGKHWVSELESSRHILWNEQWRRIDEVAIALRQTHPESFRPVQVRCRKGEQKQFWAFTKSVRLKRYGRKRIAIVHEHEDLTDTPRFLVTDALHWESGRMIETWSFRWAAEVFHEFSKQGTGLEAAQVRNEEAVNRHLRLSCLAQSVLQRVPIVAATSEQFAFAKGESTFGQRCRTITREVFSSLLAVAKRLFAGGYSCEQVAEALLPA
jgi:DDE superfamily endonuclease